MKRIGKNNNRLIRILVNEIGAINRELLNNLKEKDKIEDSFSEISLIESSSPEEDYLYFSGIGIELNVYLDSIQFIASFLKEAIQEVLINENLSFNNILCKHFSIFGDLCSLDYDFFSEYISGHLLSNIYQSSGEYILTFINNERMVRTDFYFPCFNNGDNYIKVRVYIKGEPSNTLKIISPNKEEISTTLMEFLKSEIYRKK